MRFKLFPGVVFGEQHDGAAAFENFGCQHSQPPRIKYIPEYIQCQITERRENLTNGG
jgi:hypothetical protein